MYGKHLITQITITYPSVFSRECHDTVTDGGRAGRTVDTATAHFTAALETLLTGDTVRLTARVVLLSQTTPISRVGKKSRFFRLNRIFSD